MTIPDRWSEIGHGLLRIAAGLLFSMHGAQKLLGWFGGFGPGGGTAPLGSIFGVAGILELAGGILILLGLFTRPVAFIVCGEMAYAFFTQHVPRGGFWAIENGGEPAALYAFIFLFLCLAGSGAFAIDRVIARRKRAGYI